MMICGKVENGLGRARGQAERSEEALTEALGCTPVPGTLNVRLPETFVPPAGAHPIHLRQFGEREMPYSLFAGQIAGFPVWVARSLSQMTLSDDLLEVLSTVHLRTALGLRDGDPVVIDLAE